MSVENKFSLIKVVVLSENQIHLTHQYNIPSWETVQVLHIVIFDIGIIKYTEWLFDLINVMLNM